MILLVTSSLPKVQRMDSPHLGRLLQPRHAGSIEKTAEAGIPWAADNDCFGGMDDGWHVRWHRFLATIAHKPGCLFVAAPDVVGDAKTTLQLFMKWRSVIVDDLRLPIAYVLQDGLAGVGIPWDLTDAIFVGGTDDFKLSAQARRAVEEAKGRGKWTHMGRVNGRRRLELAKAWGVDSVDGSSFAKWFDTWVPKAIEWIEGPTQTALMGSEGGVKWQTSSR